MSETVNPPLVCTIVWINQTGGILQIQSNLADPFRLAPDEESPKVTFIPAHLFRVSAVIATIGDRPQGKIDLSWRTVEDKFALIQQDNDGLEIALQLMPKISPIAMNLLVTLVVDNDGILIVGTIDVQDVLPPDDRNRS